MKPLIKHVFRRRRKPAHHPLPHRGQLPRILKRIYVAAAILLALHVIGTVGFYFAEYPRHDLSDALFMTLITITTVGYGETVQLTGFGQRMFAGFIALAGFGTVTFLFTSLTVFFLESDFDFSLRRRRMNKKIDRLHGHYLVCGYGRVGYNVGNELARTGRTFVAIEPDLQRLLEQADRNEQLIWTHGDATDDEVLADAGIDHARGVFAVSNDDAKNMMIAFTAKHLNPKVRVVARCHELRNVEKLRKAGADSVVLPDFTGGMRIVSMMVRPHVQSFLEEMLRSEQQIRMEEVHVPEGFKPRPLGTLKLRSADYILVAVRIGHDWRFNPQEDFELRAGQVLVTMATPAGCKELEAALAT